MNYIRGITMDEKAKILKKLAYQTMFEISDEEMPAFIEEYDIFMSHVKALEAIDTEGVEPLAFPYEIETTFLREDQATRTIKCEEALKNCHSVQDHQIKVPKVV